MSNAKRDENRVTTITAILETDGLTIENIFASPTTHALKVDDDTTGSDNGPTPERAVRDGNYVKTLYAVSSVDGETPVALYTNASNELLIDQS